MNKSFLELDRKFRYFGGLSLKYRYKCIGLLPEIFRHQIHLQKGYKTIEEYAARFAGISHQQTRLTLNLEQRFADKPSLHKALTEGEISISKLSRVAAIATKENHEEVAAQAKLLSKSALDVYVKDVKISGQGLKMQNGLFGPQNKSKSMPGQNSDTPLNLASDVQQELLELQSKGINISELLREFLQQRKINLAQEKEQLAARAKNSDGKAAGDMPSRHIPTCIKKHLQREHGTKCSIETCPKPSTQIHHTQRFSLGKNHDPRYLAPLCKEHHQIAHSIDQKYQMARRR